MPPTARAFVFGSRATGRARRTSDLDLAIDLGRSLTRRESLDLAEGFDESDIPYRVDIVDLHAASDGFKAIVERDKVALPRDP
ncbi:MAG: nucleotidyltransferase domain-containing protein [Roseiarcus sp.]